MRAAIYYTPPPGDPLCEAAARWLGRNAFDGEPTRPEDEELDALVERPARYGFHATLKAPFRLADDADLGDVDAHLAAFCAARAPVGIGAPALSRIGPFFAIVPADRPSPALIDLAADAVRGFEPFRAPLSEAERRRYDYAALSERQRQTLEAVGYPYSFEDFTFHMTLTGPIATDDQPVVRSRLHSHFAGQFERSLTIDRIALFVEPARGAPLRVHSMHLLTGQ